MTLLIWTLARCTALLLLLAMSDSWHSRDTSSQAPQQAAGRLTSYRLFDSQASLMCPSRIVLRNPVSGRKVCLPGVSTLGNDWTVPGTFKIHQVLGQLVFVVGDDGRVDSNGEQFRVSAVMAFEPRRPAPPSFLLIECASVENVVDVVFGEHVGEFVGLPCEERELLDLSGVSTPSTPSSPSPPR